MNNTPSTVEQQFFSATDSTSGKTLFPQSPGHGLNVLRMLYGASPLMTDAGLAVYNALCVAGVKITPEQANNVADELKKSNRASFTFDGPKPGDVSSFKHFSKLDTPQKTTPHVLKDPDINHIKSSHLPRNLISPISLHKPSSALKKPATAKPKPSFFS